MSEASYPDATPIFRTQSRFISISEPENAAEGQLVILATWLGGKAKHIAKYVNLYKRLAPNARILLIKGPVDGYLWPYRIQRRYIRPAIAPIAEVLKASKYNDRDGHDTAQTEARPHILLHIFSNGGANNVLQLLQVWKLEMGIPLPLSGLIIDSALAAGGYKQNYRAFQQSIPNHPILKLLSPIPSIGGLLLLEASIALGRYPRPETAMRECVLDETLLQVRGMDCRVEQNRNAITSPSKAKRICYFASKADQNTPFQDIISHAEEAKRRGWDVDLRLWNDTQHCNHLGKHEKEYTQAVSDMWTPVTIKAKL